MSAAVQVLKELEAAVLAVSEADAAHTKAAKKARLAVRDSQYAAARVDRATRARDSLVAAADLLAPDWREWQWVRDAGFAAQVPVMRVPEEET